jgi:hypothetical protein
LLAGARQLKSYRTKTKEASMANPDDPRIRGLGHKVNPAAGSKPTPTQDENDRFALGEHIFEHEKDGSPEQTVPAVTKEDLKKAADKSRADGIAKLATGKPTLTQEENDRAKMEGLVVGEKHEDDGSGPDPFEEQRQEQHKREQEQREKVQTRQMEAGKNKPSGSYQTRAATPVPPASKSE